MTKPIQARKDAPTFDPFAAGHCNIMDDPVYVLEDVVQIRVRPTPESTLLTTTKWAIYSFHASCLASTYMLHVAAPFRPKAVTSSPRSWCSAAGPGPAGRDPAAP